MKKVIYTLAVLCAAFINAQVGINTETPAAVLDIDGNGTDAESVAYTTGQGVLIPRFDAIPDNNTAPGADDGEMVYVNGDGFYYWDATNTSWSPVSTPLGVSVNCFDSGLSGILIDGNASSVNYVVSYSNLGDAETLTFSAADITVTPSGSATANSVSVTPSVGSATINQGETVVVTYAISLTPGGVGETLTFNLNANGFTCSSSLTILDSNSGTLAQATLGTAEAFTYSTQPTGTGIGGAAPRFRQQIGRDESNRIVVQIPYTASSLGDYVGFTGIVPDAEIMGIALGFGARDLYLTYPAGTLTATTGFIEAYITSETENTVEIEHETTDLDNGNATSSRTVATWNGAGRLEFNGTASGTVTLTNQSLVYDKQTIGSSIHNFYYDVVEITVGGNTETWLRHNLGAEYANQSSEFFAPGFDTTDRTDINAAGSLFQWGRDSDGHELVNYTTLAPVLPTIVEDQITYTAGNQRTSFVAINDSDWRIADDSPAYSGTAAGDDNFLWGDATTVDTDFNPCPIGFHVPSAEELYNASVAFDASITDTWTYPPTTTQNDGEVADTSGKSNAAAEAAFNGPLNITAPGSRNPIGGVIESPELQGYSYWVRDRFALNANGGNGAPLSLDDTQATAFSYFGDFGSIGNNTIRANNQPKTTGLAIRCKKD